MAPPHITRPLPERRLSARNEAAPDYLERREKILRSAALVFRDRGYSGTSLNDIAKLAGCDRASVYYYFSTKRDIFHELVHSHVASNIAEAEEILSRQDLSATERLRLIIVALMESFERSYPNLYIYIQEDLSKETKERTEFSAAMRNLSRRYDSVVKSLIEDGIRSGELRPDLDSRVAAFGIIGMLNWTHRWFRPDRDNARDIGTVFADVVLSGMLERGHAPDSTRPTNSASLVEP
jgi:AcrR family transcriptional regulator